jgi:polysaccharide export outer membrane protein
MAQRLRKPGLYENSDQARGTYMKFLLLSLALVPAAFAQEPAPANEPSEVPEQYAEYEVGPGDLVSVSVFNMTQFNQTARVSNSGKIHVRYLGILSVANLTVAQIEDEMARKLREQQLVNDPWVRVQVVEYNSQPVFVVGEVNVPGQYMINGKTHLLDVVSRAGGFTPGAAADGFLIRRRDFSTSKIEVRMKYEAEQAAPDPLRAVADESQSAPLPARNSITVNIGDLKEGKRPELNVRVQGGDIFYVPRRVQQHIYIVGEVLFPGGYGLPQFYDHITAARAISYAGGPLRTAKAGKTFIMRRDPAGGVQQLSFDFNDITEGKKPDIAVMPNDIIFVPRSIAKTIGYGMLIMVPHMIQQFLIF